MVRYVEHTVTYSEQKNWELSAFQALLRKCYYVAAIWVEMWDCVTSYHMHFAILHKPFYTEKDAYIKISTSCFSLQQILEAKATAVCLNKDYRPSRIPPELLSKLQLYLSKDSEGSSDDADNLKNSCS